MISKSIRAFTCWAIFASALALPVRAQEAVRGRAVGVNPGDLKLGTLAGLPTCLTGAVVHGDPAKGPFAAIEKLNNGCTIPWHWHTASEQIAVIDGAMELEHQDSKEKMSVGPGGYYFNPGHHVHRGGCPGACTIFVTVDGKIDVHYVDAAGKEITPAEALGARAAK